MLTVKNCPLSRGLCSFVHVCARDFTRAITPLVDTFESVCRLIARDGSLAYIRIAYIRIYISEARESAARANFVNKFALPQRQLQLHHLRLYSRALEAN